MSLYNLVNVAGVTPDMSAEELRNFPSYIRIGHLPFSRIYLVSKSQEKALAAAKEMNELPWEGPPVMYEVRELSTKGKLRFYRDRYILGNISFYLGNSMDMDSGDDKLSGHLEWYVANLK